MRTAGAKSLEIQFWRNAGDCPVGSSRSAQADDLIGVLDGDMVRGLAIGLSLVEIGDPIAAIVLFDRLLKTGRQFVGKNIANDRGALFKGDPSLVFASFHGIGFYRRYGEANQSRKNVLFHKVLIYIFAALKRAPGLN